MENEHTQALEKSFSKILKKRIKKVPRDELNAIITKFLEENMICTLATCSNNIPRSTPVRYGAKGLTIYISSEGGGKIKNIRKNPKVSISLYGEYAGFMSVRCLQIWGEATIIDPEERPEEYTSGRKTLKTEQRQDLKNIDISKTTHKMKLIKIEPYKARYLSFPEGIINQVLMVREK